MPLYEYECPKHGLFRDWRGMSESELPTVCPDCGRLANRMVSAPRLGIGSDIRKIHAINEKSANEPRVVRKRRDEPIPVHDTHRDLTERQNHNHDHVHTRDKDRITTQRSTHPWAVRH